MTKGLTTPSVTLFPNLVMHIVLSLNQWLKLRFYVESTNDVHSDMFLRQIVSRIVLGLTFDLAAKCIFQEIFSSPIYYLLCYIDKTVKNKIGDVTAIQTLPIFLIAPDHIAILPV